MELLPLSTARPWTCINGNPRFADGDLLAAAPSADSAPLMLRPAATPPCCASVSDSDLLPDPTLSPPVVLCDLERPKLRMRSRILLMLRFSSFRSAALPIMALPALKRSTRPPEGPFLSLRLRSLFAFFTHLNTSTSLGNGFSLFRNLCQRANALYLLRLTSSEGTEAEAPASDLTAAKESTMMAAETVYASQFQWREQRRR